MVFEMCTQGKAHEAPTPTCKPIDTQAGKTHVHKVKPNTFKKQQPSQARCSPCVPDPHPGSLASDLTLVLPRKGRQPPDPRPLLGT